MLMDLLKYRLLPKLKQLKYNYSENASVSYSQCGEDLIMRYLLKVLGMDKVNYLDVGARIHLLEQYLSVLQKRGQRGVRPSRILSCSKHSGINVHRMST